MPTLKADLLVLRVFMGTTAVRLRAGATAVLLPLLPPFPSRPSHTVANSSGEEEEEPFVNEDLLLTRLRGEFESALEFSSTVTSTLASTLASVEESSLFFSRLLDGASWSFSVSSSPTLLPSVLSPWRSRQGAEGAVWWDDVESGLGGGCGTPPVWPPTTEEDEEMLEKGWLLDGWSLRWPYECPEEEGQRLVKGERTMDGEERAW